MKMIFGIIDESGEVYTAYNTEDEARGLNYVPLVENFTWEPSDWTDSENRNWIRVSTLANAFDNLCRSTGVKKTVLASICHKNATTFSRYCSGMTPVPRLIWEAVDRLPKIR